MSEPTTLAERADGCRENAAWWHARAEGSDDPDGATIMTGWAAEWTALADLVDAARAVPSECATDAEHERVVEETLGVAVDRLAARLEMP